MNIIRKYMGFMLVLAISITSLNITAFSENATAEEIFPDKRFETASGIFVRLGVFEKTPDFSATLTREEFAKIISAALKLPVSNSVRNGVYADVPGKYKAAPYITAATEAGVFSASGNKYFYPHKTLTEDDAVIALVNSAGYRMMAEKNGGSITAYLQQASLAGITKNVKITEGESITYEKLLILMYNAFSADSVVTERFEGKTPIYSVMEDVTLFSRIYDAKTDEGVVIADSFTYLDGVRDGNEKTLIIDNSEFKGEYDCSLTGGEELLGHKVEYTYTDDDENGMVLLAIESHKKNKILSIDSKMVEDSEQGSLTYDKGDGTLKKLKIPDSISVIYNKRAYYYATPETFRPSNGCLEFIDNNGDGRYDVVFIESYLSFVLWSADKENLILYPDLVNNGMPQPVQTGGEKIPDMIKIGEKEYMTIIRDGKELSSLARLKKGEAVSVMQSDPSSGEVLTTVIASSKKVSGTVTGLTRRSHSPYSYLDSDGNTKSVYGIDTIKLGDEEYFVAGDVMMDIELNVTGDFIVDFMGNIIGKTDGSAEKSLYAYLTNAGYDEEENKLFLKMLYENGIHTAEYFSEKINIDGNVMKFSDRESAAPVFNRLTMASGYTGIGAGGYAQPLKITFKSNGTVSKVETILDKDGNPDTDENSTGLIKSRGEAGKALMYKSYTGIFDGEFAVDDSTIVFQAKMDPSVKNYDMDNFVVTNRTLFDNDATYNVVAYDMTEFGYAPVVVSYHTTDLLKQGGIMIVQEIIDAWNEQEQMPVKRISGYYYNGNKVSIDVMPDKTLSEDVTEGDVIRVLITKAGRLYSYNMVFDNEKQNSYTDGLPVSSSSTAYTATTRLVYGHVEKSNGTLFTLNYGTGERVYSLTGAKIFVYDGDNVKTGSSSDFVSNHNREEVLDRVVVYTNAGRVRSVYIYKGGAQ